MVLQQSQTREGHPGLEGTHCKEQIALRRRRPRVSCATADRGRHHHSGTDIEQITRSSRSIPIGELSFTILSEGFPLVLYMLHNDNQTGRPRLLFCMNKWSHVERCQSSWPLVYGYPGKGYT